MRLLAAFFAMVLSGRAAVLQGYVFDFESGRPLARSVVTLTSIQGGAPAQATRTESNGSFFFGTAPSVYLLTLERRGFSIYRYGAKCWNCPGAALFLNGDERTVVDIRMKRLGALSGTLLDENQVGIPDLPIAIYTATRPPVQAGKTKSDDRGFFRLGELQPGPYLIRTIAEQTRDGMSYLSSFYPEGVELRQSRPVTVELEHTLANIDFPPVPGKLFRVQGKIVMPAPGATNAVALISDSGRVEAPVSPDGAFFFDRVSPGSYELFAEGRVRSTYYAAWQAFLVERDTEFNAQMMPCYGMFLDITADQRRQIRSNEFKITMRRKDLDRDGPEILITQQRTPDIAPGNWEISVDPGTDSYVRDINVAGNHAAGRSKSSAEGWNLVRIGGGNGMIKVTIAKAAAAITGRVFDKPNEAAAWAPVFLETLDLDPPDPPIIRTARAAADGSFQFKGLPPGKYRILSTFDLDPSDRSVFEAARPAEFTLTERSTSVQELSLYHRN